MSSFFQSAYCFEIHPYCSMYQQLLFFIADQNSIYAMHISHFIFAFTVDEHFGCFQFRANMDTTCTQSCACFCVHINHLQDKCPRAQLMGPTVSTQFCKKLLCFFSRFTIPLYIPISNVCVILFLSILASIWC